MKHAFPSGTNLKLENNPVISKMIKEIISDLFL